MKFKLWDRTIPGPLRVLFAELEMLAVIILLKVIIVGGAALWSGGDEVVIVALSPFAFLLLGIDLSLRKGKAWVAGVWSALAVIVPCTLVSDFVQDGFSFGKSVVVFLLWSSAVVPVLPSSRAWMTARMPGRSGFWKPFCIGCCIPFGLFALAYFSDIVESRAGVKRARPGVIRKEDASPGKTMPANGCGLRSEESQDSESRPKIK